MVEKPKVKIKDYEFELSDEYTALVLVIQDLTREIKRRTDRI